MHMRRPSSAGIVLRQPARGAGHRPTALPVSGTGWGWGRGSVVYRRRLRSGPKGPARDEVRCHPAGNRLHPGVLPLVTCARRGRFPADSPHRGRDGLPCCIGLRAPHDATVRGARARFVLAGCVVDDGVRGRGPPQRRTRCGSPIISRVPLRGTSPVTGRSQGVASRTVMRLMPWMSALCPYSGSPSSTGGTLVISSRNRCFNSMRASQAPRQ